MNSYHKNMFGSKSTINDVEAIGNQIAGIRVPPTITPLSPNAAGQYQASSRPTSVNSYTNYFSDYRSSPSLPLSLQGSVSSVNEPTRFPRDDRILLLAMKRGENIDGSTYLVLVQPKTGERFNVEESLLATYEIRLGDFLNAEKESGSSNTLKNFVKKDISKDSDFRFSVKVNDDKAVVNGNKANLKKLQNGPKVFRSKHFGDAFCEQQNLQRGTYIIRLELSPRPLTCSPGQDIHFRATDASVFKRTPNAYRKPPNQNQNRNQYQIPNQTLPIITRSGFAEKQPTQKVTGTGFTEKQKPTGKPITGNGFKPAAPKNASIVGVGFEGKAKPLQKSRAIVMSKKENLKGNSTYFLWLLDEKAEGRFMSNHNLQVGHCFEGKFRGVNSKNTKRFECEEYTKGFEEPLIQGGIDENEQIYLEVRGENYQKAVNHKFATLEADWIGSIFDTESKLTKKEGALVKIQRKGVADNESVKYVWSIMEVL